MRLVKRTAPIIETVKRSLRSSVHKGERPVALARAVSWCGANVAGKRAVFVSLKTPLGAGGTVKKIMLPKAIISSM